jgi:hypothetical protein
MGQNESSQKGIADQQVDNGSQAFGDSAISSSAPSMSFTQTRAEFNQIKHNLTRFELRSLQAAFHGYTCFNHFLISTQAYPAFTFRKY